MPSHTEKSIEIKFNEEIFLKQIRKLENSRFKSIENLKQKIYDLTSLNIKLEQKSNNADEAKEGYDYTIVSNCQINGLDLCFLDVNYIFDNDNKLYITSVDADFAT